mmetsp:Transcript_129135/g.306406  ORF Transcript_129135/g.306406 Transcript_129135/m.306406 type:complete len:314 (+) Transcript_129135:2233-3174(+)
MVEREHWNTHADTLHVDLQLAQGIRLEVNAQVYQHFLVADHHANLRWMRFALSVHQLLADNLTGGHGFLAIFEDIHLDGICKKPFLCRRRKLEDLHLVLETNDSTNAHLARRGLVLPIGTDLQGETAPERKAHYTIWINGELVRLGPSHEFIRLLRDGNVAVRPEAETQLDILQKSKAALHPDVWLEFHAQLKVFREEQPGWRSKVDVLHLHRKVVLLAEGCVEVHRPAAEQLRFQAHSHGALELSDVEDLHIDAPSWGHRNRRSTYVKGEGVHKLRCVRLQLAEDRNRKDVQHVVKHGGRPVFVEVCSCANI